MRNVPVFYQTGYTLIELVIVVVILGLIAAVAVPAATSGPDKKLELAAQEFAAAIRFARAESVRTGRSRGFQFESGTQRIRVWRADTASNPATIVYDVYHPVDKSVYDFSLAQQSLAAAKTVSSNTLYRGACSTPDTVYFDSNGSPWCATPGNVLLESFVLILQTGSRQSSVTLDGITGRVVVR